MITGTMLEVMDKIMKISTTGKREEALVAEIEQRMRDIKTVSGSKIVIDWIKINPDDYESFRFLARRLDLFVVSDAMIEHGKYKLADSRGEVDNFLKNRTNWSKRGARSEE